MPEKEQEASLTTNKLKEYEKNGTLAPTQDPEKIEVRAKILNNKPTVVNSVKIATYMNKYPDKLRSEVVKKWQPAMCVQGRPTLKTMTNFCNEKELQFLIQGIKNSLKNLIDSVKVNDKPEEKELYDLSFYIVENFSTLSLEDVFLFCEKAKFGEFKRPYEGNRIDITIITDWLRYYDAEIVSEARERHIQNQYKPKNPGQGRNDALSAIKNVFDKVLTESEQQAIRETSTARDNAGEREKHKQARSEMSEYLMKKQQEKEQEENNQSDENEK